MYNLQNFNFLTSIRKKEKISRKVTFEMRNPSAAASVISKHKRTSFFFLILIKSLLYYQPFSFLFSCCVREANSLECKVLSATTSPTCARNLRLSNSFVISDTGKYVSVQMRTCYIHISFTILYFIISHCLSKNTFHPY